MIDIYRGKDELLDSSSDLFISHATTLEAELQIIMARSPEVNSVTIKVTRFLPLESSINFRKRRQAIDKAVSEFEIFIVTGESAVAASVQGRNLKVL